MQTSLITMVAMYALDLMGLQLNFIANACRLLGEPLGCQCAFNVHMGFPFYSGVAHFSQGTGTIWDIAVLES